MTPDRPTRRGFLAACSAAAAALGLTTRAAPARPPIPAKATPARSPIPPEIAAGDATVYYTVDAYVNGIKVADGGAGYASNPAVTFTGGGGPGTRLDWKLTKVST
jgi:hypothetical protein